MFSALLNEYPVTWGTVTGEVVLPRLTVKSTERPLARLVPAVGSLAMTIFLRFDEWMYEVVHKKPSLLSCWVAAEIVKPLRSGRLVDVALPCR